MKASSALVTNWNELRTDLLWAYDGPIQIRFRQCAFSPAGIVAWLIRRGQVTLQFNSGQKQETYGEGQWIFPKDEDAEQEFSQDAIILSVRFEAEWSDGTPLFDRSRTIGFAKNEAKILTRIGERLAKRVESSQAPEGAALEQMPRDIEHHFEMRRLFNGWLAAYAQVMQQQGLVPQIHQPLDERVWRAISRLDARHARVPFREEELASFIGLSVTQLNRLFVANLGMTSAEFWEKKRVRTARAALLESSHSIKWIAYDQGFGSLQHFSAWVKKHMGSPPREFRKRHRDSAKPERSLGDK